MAIPASRLGVLIAQEWESEERLILRLREHGLLQRRASDAAVREAFRMAKEEHAALPPGNREFNSPNERVRVFLAPYLSRKGRAWARPFIDDRAPVRMALIVIAILGAVGFLINACRS